MGSLNDFTNELYSRDTRDLTGVVINMSCGGISHIAVNKKSVGMTQQTSVIILDLAPQYMKYVRNIARSETILVVFTCLAKRTDISFDIVDVMIVFPSKKQKNPKKNNKNKQTKKKHWEYLRNTGGSRLFIQPSIKAQMKENIKAPHHWPLWGGFTGHRWIPRTNGQ